MGHARGTAPGRQGSRPPSPRPFFDLPDPNRIWRIQKNSSEFNVSGSRIWAMRGGPRPDAKVRGLQARAHFSICQIQIGFGEYKKIRANSMFPVPEYGPCAGDRARTPRFAASKPAPIFRATRSK